MLTREPEHETVAEGIKNNASLAELYSSLKSSDEFYLRILEAGIYQPVTKDDIALLRRFIDPSRKPVPGFVVDFLGTRTDVRFLAYIASIAGSVEGLPLPGNFHSKAYEWIGSLRAVAEASGRFTMLELGAGWGPWLVACSRAASMRGIPRVNLIGVEGDIGHFEFLNAHLRNNGIDLARHRIMHGVIAPNSGSALFPIAEDPAESWGPAARFFTTGAGAQQALDREADLGGPHYALVPLFTLAEAIGDHRYVDLVHIDIQGAEADVIETGEAILNERVARVVVGTHGRDIEARLHAAFSRMKWHCEFDDPCRHTIRQSLPVLHVDGTQVWKNPALTPSSTGC
jgi:FkbM family methyltransferase